MKIVYSICTKKLAKKRNFHVSSPDETMLLDIHDCSQGYILFFFFLPKEVRKKLHIVNGQSLSPL